jgi:hypothetical protein
MSTGSPSAPISPAPRAVVFIGPPKTASTHIQELLANNQDSLRILGWTWPRGLWGSKANAKSFANLATALSGQGCSPHYRVKAAHYLSMLSMCRGPPFDNASQVLSFFAAEFERVRASSAPNLIFSAEGERLRNRQYNMYFLLVDSSGSTLAACALDLAFFDGSTSVHRIARKALRRLLSGYASVDVVIAYRTPRVHLLHSLFTEEINEAAASQLITDASTQRYAISLRKSLVPFLHTCGSSHVHARPIRAVSPAGCRLVLPGDDFFMSRLILPRSMSAVSRRAI